MLDNNYFTYESDGKYYIYSAISGCIYPSNKIIYRVAKEILKQKKISSSNKELSLWTSEELEEGLSKLSKIVDEDKKLDESKSNLIRSKLIINENDWLSGKVVNKMSLSLVYDCNLKCRYCNAEGDTYNSRSMMSIDTAKKCIDYFFKYANRTVSIYIVDFIGGEPLMNKDVFLYSTHYINEYVKQIGIPVHYIITTNGTIMDNEIMSAIIENNIYVNVSIEGSKKTHDVNRKYVNGSDAFVKVAEAIRSMLNQGYSNMAARITMTKHGVSALMKDVEILWDIGFYHIFINMMETDIEELAFDDEAMACFDRQLDQLVNSGKMKNMMLKGKYIRNFLDDKTMIQHRALKSECSFLNANSLLFTPEGDLYKCSFTVGDKKHCIGNIDTKIDWSKYSKDYEDDERCKICWARRLCKGGGYIDKSDLYCQYSKVMAKNSLKFYSMLYELEQY